jgi:hypothetical protein
MLMEILYLILALLAFQGAGAAMNSPTHSFSIISNLAVRRSLQLTDEEQAQFEECDAAVVEFVNASSELDRTLRTLDEHWIPDLQGCIEGAVRNSTNVTCKIDSLEYKNGDVYGAFASACEKSGRLLALVDAVANCSFALGTSSVKLDIDVVSLPQCILSQDEEPSCDPQILKRSFEARFETLEQGSCQANATARIDTVPETPEERDSGDTEGNSAAATSACCGAFEANIFLTAVWLCPCFICYYLES